MFADFRLADVETDLATDVCVIGGGAAGITLARELIGGPLRVCLLESGGFQFDAGTQGLYRGRNVGLPSFPLDAARLRYFGGSTNHWLAWCTELAEIDFRPRAWIPHSGWPVTYQDVAPFYARARAVLGLEPGGDREILQRLPVEPLPLSAQKLVPHLWQIGDPPLRFGEAFRHELTQARNVRVILHANVTELGVDAAATRVEHVVVKNLDGKTGRVRARIYVLACGGVENPRLLLASNRVVRAGLGNRHDLVGRFFADHFQPHFGDVLSDDADRLLDASWQTDGRRRYLTAVAMSEDVQAAEGVANTAVYMVGTRTRASATRARAEHRDGSARDEGGGDLTQQIGRILHDLEGTARAAWQRWVRGSDDPAALGTIRLTAFGDQVPNPESRVTLASERDALGVPRVELDWRLTELDRRGMAVLGRTLGAELGRLGLGRVKLAPWVLDDGADWSPHLVAGNHHLGTTRMADDPGHGVVDRHCRVHGIENLYVGGSSVFPTTGFANPTLTILAFSLRLADHLKDRLPPSGGVRS